MIRTFIDTGVLIAAARGQGIIASQALAILDDPNREFVSTLFLKLELLPKSIYHKKSAETTFYETYFNAVAIWVETYQQIVELAYQEAGQIGLAAMDALHVSAASIAQADEFVTTEKSTKPLHRTKLVRVVSIQSDGDSVWGGL